MKCLATVFGCWLLFQTGCTCNVSTERPSGRQAEGGLRTFERSTYAIDAAFARKYGVAVPVEARFSVAHEPRDYANATTLRRAGTEGGYMAFRFLDGERVVEEVTVRDNHISGPDREARLAQIESAVADPGAREAECEAPVVKRIQVRAHDAVQVFRECRYGVQSVVKLDTIVLGRTKPYGITFNTIYHAPDSEVRTMADAPARGLNGGFATIIDTFEIED